VRQRRDALLLLATASVASTLRVPLDVSPRWYGFALVVPVYLLLAYVLFEYLPARGVYTRRAALAWLPVVAVICTRDVAVQREQYALKRFPIETPRGTLYDWSEGRARALTAFAREVRDGTLVVLPEGVTLNYFTGVPSSIGFHTFTPIEIELPETQRAIVEELRAHPPARVALVTRDVREYGYRGFGDDYGQPIMAFVAQRYRLERQWREPGFTLLLLRR
jgi:hypothetical protein